MSPPAVALTTVFSWKPPTFVAWRRQRRQPAHEVGRVAVERVGRRDQAGPGDEPEPQRDERDVRLAAGEGDVAVAVGHRHDREDRLQPLRAPRGGRELGDRHVRRAVPADLAVAPRLLARPADHLGAVALLVRPEGVPVALRAAGAAHVHDDVGVAALHEVLVDRGERPLLVVGRLGDEHRVPAGLVGPVDVRAEDGAVGHRDRHVPVHHDAVRLRPVVLRPLRRGEARRRQQAGASRVSEGESSHGHHK